MRDQDCILIFIPLLPEGRGGYTVFHPSKIYFVTLFSVTVDGRDLIFGHKLHIGTPYRGKHFWTHQIPTSCLPTLLIFIHIEHTFCICPFLVAFFSATIDGRNAVFGHKLHIGTPYGGKRFLTRQIPTSCLGLFSIVIISKDKTSITHLWVLKENNSDMAFIGGETTGYI
jgi:hypothetical protein